MHCKSIWPRGEEGERVLREHVCCFSLGGLINALQTRAEHQSRVSNEWLSSELDDHCHFFLLPPPALPYPLRDVLRISLLYTKYIHIFLDHHRARADAAIFLRLNMCAEEAGQSQPKRNAKKCVTPRGRAVKGGRGCCTLVRAYRLDCSQ